MMSGGKVQNECFVCVSALIAVALVCCFRFYVKGDNRAKFSSKPDKGREGYQSPDYAKREDRFYLARTSMSAQEVYHSLELSFQRHCMTKLPGFKVVGNLKHPPQGQLSVSPFLSEQFL